MKKQLDIDIELLKAMFKCTQGQLKEVIEDFLRDTYGYENTIVADKYVIGIGEIPVGLVAHLDTVHSTPAYTVYHDQEEEVMWSPMGLGADDRAGVYSIISIIKRGYRPTVIFTTDEEIGGVGASKIASDFAEMPSNMKFLVELDRRGSEDSVFYECNNPLFENYINKFGFITDIGSFSDICMISPDWGIAAVNLSIGYYNEHTHQEHLKLREMSATIDKVCRILDDAENADKFEFIQRSSTRWWESAYNEYPREDDEVCWSCLGTFPKDQVVHTEAGETYCIDCYGKYIRYCDNCGCEYSVTNNVYSLDQNLCPTCAKDYFGYDN